MPKASVIQARPIHNCQFCAGLKRWLLSPLHQWIAKLENSARHDKRLAVIVPYRNRPQHLVNFVEHMQAYFRHDKLDRRIAITLHVVEQAGDAPFNRGKLLNAGFALTQDQADYVCFHDVDYLPLWADYSFSPRPARLIWHGLSMKENWETFLGGVTLFDKASFERVNGFPNVYWGWGFEDAELGARLRLAGITWERRDGFYVSLPHPHNGITPQGAATAEAQATANLFRGRLPDLNRLMHSDGLGNLNYTVLKSQPVRMNGAELPNATHHLVNIE